MISAEDIEAFQADSEPAFKAGRAFVRRKKKGLPSDRWATVNTMGLVADCIERQWAIIGMMTDALAEYQQDAIRRTDEAMGCYDRNGTRTS